MPVPNLDDRKFQDIVDEINADIVAYKTRYRRILFVVFDIGVIRNEHQFKKSIEAVADVDVMVIKW